MTGALEFLLVRLGRRRVGLPLEHVVAVEDIAGIHPVPAAAAACRGLAPVRGHLVPVVDLRQLLQDPEPPARADTMGILLRLGSALLLLDVDEAEAVVQGELLPVPAGETLPWAVAVTRRDDAWIPILDIAALATRLTAMEVPHADR